MLSIKKHINGLREINLFNCFIFNYKKKYNKIINGIGNSIDIPKNTNMQIYINGNNNKIKIKSSLNTDSLITIFINGNNNKIVINNIIKGLLHLTIGNGKDLPADNCSCYFGKNLSITESTKIILYENGTSFKCGDDVMISHGVTFRGSDGHSILSFDGKVLNKANGIKIGNNVWICQDVLISKNAEVPDCCIVGTKALVTKKFTQSNCIIAGIPAKIIKENINWIETPPDR